MTPFKSLADVACSMRSESSFLEARGLEQFAGPLRHFIPAVEAFCSGSPTPAGFVGPASGDDRLLTVAEVAQKLGVSPDHVYRHAASWAFTRRVGTRALRFSEQGLEFWLQKQKKQG